MRDAGDRKEESEINKKYLLQNKKNQFYALYNKKQMGMAWK